MKPDWVSQEDWDSSADLRSACCTIACVVQTGPILEHSLTWSYRPGLVVIQLQKVDGSIPNAQVFLGVRGLAGLGSKSVAAVSRVKDRIYDLYKQLLTYELESKLKVQK